MASALGRHTPALCKILIDDYMGQCISVQVKLSGCTACWTSTMGLQRRKTSELCTAVDLTASPQTLAPASLLTISTSLASMLCARACLTHLLSTLCAACAQQHVHAASHTRPCLPALIRMKEPSFAECAAASLSEHVLSTLDCVCLTQAKPMSAAQQACLWAEASSSSTGI